MNFLDNQDLKLLWKDFFEFDLPNRRTINKKVDQIEEKIYSLLLPSLSAIEYTAVEVDGWTSVSNLQFNAILAHFISDDWMMREICLGVGKVCWIFHGPSPQIPHH